MKDINITVNYGLYLGKTKKNIQKTTLNLIKSNKACFGIDSANNLYIEKNNKIIGKSLYAIQSEKYFGGTYIVPKEINSIFKYKHTQFAVELSFQERDMWIDNDKYITLYLYPIKILVEGYWLNVNPKITGVIEIYGVTVKENIRQFTTGTFMTGMGSAFETLESLFNIED